MNGNEKSAMRRVGLLCLIVSGMTMISCQQEPVNPPVHLPALSVAPQSFRVDSIRVNDDQPPKDVGSGSRGTVVTATGSPADSVRVTDDQPPKDVGSGSGTGGK